MTAARRFKWGIATLGGVATVIIGIALAAHFKLIHFRGQWMYLAQSRVQYSWPNPPLTGSIPSFSEFLKSQPKQILSKRLIRMSLREPTWKSAGGSDSEEDFNDFSSKLSVRMVQGEDTNWILAISYVSERKETSIAAIESITAAYKSGFEEQSAQDLIATDRGDCDKIMVSLCNLQTQLGTANNHPEMSSRIAWNMAELHKELHDHLRRIERIKDEDFHSIHIVYLSDGEKAGRVLAEKQNGQWVILETENR